MDKLKKYEIAAQIQEEAERRTEMQEIKEEKQNQPAHIINNQQINRSIRQILGEALIESYFPTPSTISTEDNIPQKIKDVTNIVRVLSSLLYQVQDAYSNYNTTDEEIKKILLDSNSKAIEICIKKLNNLWSSEEKSSQEELQNTSVENSQEEPKEEIANVVGQIMSFITKNEEIVSPAGETFIVEEISENMSRIRNKLTTKKYNIETKILKNWIQEKK